MRMPIDRHIGNEKKNHYLATIILQASTDAANNQWKQRLLSKSLLGSSISIGEGNGNPLQYSCLENPMDGGAL